VILRLMVADSCPSELIEWPVNPGRKVATRTKARMITPVIRSSTTHASRATSATSTNWITITRPRVV
jgi:hypothetical protein